MKQHRAGRQNSEELLLSPEERLRIHIVGTSGVGKSTLAKELATRLDVPHIELDTLHWLPNWREEDKDRYREKLGNAIAAPRWVLDGNYFSKSVDIQWAEQGGATTVIWCDYSLPTTLIRAAGRAVKRAWSREEIWPGTGNRESFRKSFFSHDSVVLWTMISFHSNRKRYGEIIEKKPFPHIRFIRLRNARDCREFLKQF